MAGRSADFHIHDLPEPEAILAVDEDEWSLDLEGVREVTHATDSSTCKSLWLGLKIRGRLSDLEVTWRWSPVGLPPKNLRACAAEGEFEKLGPPLPEEPRRAFGEKSTSSTNS